MREASEDLMVVSERPEWRVPVMIELPAEDAEAGGSVNSDGGPS